MPRQRKTSEKATPGGQKATGRKIHTANGKKTAALTAADKRYQEVRRSRIILGCVILSIAIILLLALLSRFARPVNLGQLTEDVREDVLQYTDAVAAECARQGISDYSVLLMALMQQESSGQGADIFQCSESPFNQEYPGTPGGITDVDYSIRVGVETFAYCLEQAKCKSIADTKALSLALQEYNFGNGYADWALANYGGYSEENAAEFSERMKAELGWDIYGDPQYVSHVLQYITF